jgi:ABC-type Fe3+/spermidine/putrescine transport system ATPase subunit
MIATGEEPMSGLTVNNIHKSFDDNLVLKGISFTQQPGEVLALLGPSGCGKSTLLAVIAGLVQPDSGQVQWNGIDLAGIPPHRRGFGLMFQDYALFPHMNVHGNVAFGLQMQKLPKSEIDEKVIGALQLVGLPSFETRDASTLSGGEQQRVALARALAPEPALLMLDEPLGSLDRTLRAQLLDDLRSIVRGAGQTTLYVTHDQEEAYALADRIVVMQAGRIAQVGTPRQIYHSPNSAFVARFIGLTNLIPGEASGDHAVTPLGTFPLQETAHGKVQVLLRPDAARLEGMGHSLTGEITDIAFMGETTRAQVRVQRINLTFEFPSTVRLPAPGKAIILYLDINQKVQIFDHDVQA